MAHITEKRLYAVSSQPLTADGTAQGNIQVDDACNLFVVGHIVILKSDTQPMIRLKIKRMPDDTTLLLGPENTNVRSFSDVSAYTVADNATIEAEEQNRPSVPEQEIERLTYAEEPAVARRVVLVDHCGNMIGEDNPLPVDAVLNIGALNIDLDAKTGDNTAISAHPSQIFVDNADVLPSAGYHTVFSYTSANNNTKLVYVTVAVSTTANVRLKINGTVRREYRTSPSDRQAHFLFHEHRSLPTGTIVEIEAEAERFILPSYTTFTALEGYIA